jgi:hypothetical protein
LRKIIKKKIDKHKKTDEMTNFQSRTVDEERQEVKDLPSNPTATGEEQTDTISVKNQ